MSEAELKHRGDVASLTELKQQLVDCIRMLEQSDIIDYNGHCSIRVAASRSAIARLLIEFGESSSGTG